MLFNEIVCNTVHLQSALKLPRSYCTSFAYSPSILCAHCVPFTYFHFKFYPACPHYYHAKPVSLSSLHIFFYVIIPCSFIARSTNYSHIELTPLVPPSCFSPTLFDKISSPIKNFHHELCRPGAAMPTPRASRESHRSPYCSSESGTTAFPA